MHAIVRMKRLSSDIRRRSQKWVILNRLSMIFQTR